MYSDVSRVFEMFKKFEKPTEDVVVKWREDSCVGGRIKDDISSLLIL
jgi:hypothetical protein